MENIVHFYKNTNKYSGKIIISAIVIIFQYLGAFTFFNIKNKTEITASSINEFETSLH